VTRLQVEKNAGSRVEWSPPVLRKLPIAATANHPGKNAIGNEGTAGGKGDNSNVIS
jgi:hypothetical protein